MKPKQFLKPIAAVLVIALGMTPVAMAVAASTPTPAPAPPAAPKASPAAQHRVARIAGHRKAHQTLVRRYRRLAHEAGVRAPLHTVRLWHNRHLRHRIRGLKTGVGGAPASMASHLRAIAACESKNNPRAVGGGGTFRGLFQFDQHTWASVGGHGDPAAASPAEQYHRAAILMKRSGSSPWPVCG
jgi:hypothetical protein